jgi:hypothetical protein
MKIAVGYCGAGWASFGQSVGMAACPGYFHQGGIIGGDLLWHELCHTFGYLADHYNGYNPPVSNQPNNVDPAAGGYIPDDAAVDSPTGYNCSQPFNLVSNPINNNVMGNSFCRQHLSARQIAAFHYLVAKNITRKYTQFNNLNYPYSPFTNTPSSFNLTGTQVLNTLPLFSTVTIKTGANITINNATLKANLNGKIIIEPGAKLTLNCVSIEPYLSGLTDLWAGIIVQGNPYIPQDIQSNGMSNNQGVLELNNCILKKARRGICAGNYNNVFNVFNINYDPSPYGGGIVFATNTIFDKNIISIDMVPKCSVSICGGNAGNLTTFNNCQFLSDDNFLNFCSSNGYPNISVRLNGVKDIKFFDCIFDFGQSGINADTTFCIKGINSSIILKKASSTSGGNHFYNGDYGVFLTNSGSKNLIEDNQFEVKNGIYLSNSNYSKIVRNTFYNNIPNITPANVLRTGVYLDNCNYYKVENNEFKTFGNKTLTEGVCVNNSGPISNKIYNNSFINLDQALWCQNQNYDPTTYDGLMLNCNDFTNCNYNIGVQTPFFPPNNNGGIATFQGFASGLPINNVRNTYNNISCGNENRFYSFTPYSNPPQVQHGNFLGSQYRVGPQPTCSDVTDINDIVGIAPVGPKSGYCPNQSALPLGKHILTAQISSLNSQIISIQETLANNVDGGNTSQVLDSVRLLNEDQLFLKLRALSYLSDTVLKNYFVRLDLTPEHAVSIFRNNSPVTRNVWQYITLNASETLLLKLTEYQNSAILSPRAILESQASMAKNERSYSIMHKIMWFLETDSIEGTGTFINTKDSIGALLQLNGQGDVMKQLIELDLNYGDYASAAAKTNTYITTSQQRLYSEFINSYISLMQDSSQLYSLQGNVVAKQYIEGIAADFDHPCQFWARNILNAVFNIPMDILKLQPETSSDGRFMNNKVEEDNKTNLTELNILMYPNPANNELMLKNLTRQTIDLKIYNVNSQLFIIDHLSADETKKINTSALTNGIYFVHLNSQNGINKINKLVIVK